MKELPPRPDLLLQRRRGRVCERSPLTTAIELAACDLKNPRGDEIFIERREAINLFDPADRRERIFGIDRASLSSVRWIKKAKSIGLVFYECFIATGFAVSTDTKLIQRRQRTWCGAVEGGECGPRFGTCCGWGHPRCVGSGCAGMDTRIRAAV